MKEIRKSESLSLYRIWKLIDDFIEENTIEWKPRVKDFFYIYISTSFLGRFTDFEV